ncbi:MAG: hypothetical protein HN389_04425 [Clostridia bacterium]|nr:hypothetical protein [Clostridia bacterium]
MRRLRNIIIAIVIAGLFAGILVIALRAQNEEEAVSTDFVMISEFMASNKSTITDENGNFSDWIEIYNPTDSAVNLFSYGLSDDSGKVKWTFPNITLGPGEYIVVFATNATTVDKNAVYQHIGFKLAADKGGIYLINDTGQPVDEIEYENQITGVSLGRNELYEWVAQQAPSPGFSNDAAGVAAFLDSRKTDEEFLIITEVMSQNRTTIADSAGDFHDYIEIYNTGSEPVSLLGYSMSDDPNNIGKWQFPDVTIGAGEYLLVFASGYETSLPGDDLYASFRISSLEETIIISNKMGLVVDSVVLREVGTDRSYARVTDEDGSYGDEWQETDSPTPRLPNTGEGFVTYMQTNVVTTGQIIINEIMVSNSTVLQEGDGEYYDWIELYNRSDAAVSLAGYSLSDDQNNPSKWKFEDITIGAGEYIVVIASGEPVDGEDEKKNYLHTNFRLSASGEVLALYDSSGALQDRYMITFTPKGVSVGRVDERNELYFFSVPTPKTANVNAFAGVLEPPSVDIRAGSYDSGVEVSLISSASDASIYYTLDGSEPSENDMLYTQPISMSATGMIRARAYLDGYINSEISTNSYFVGETHSLPILSVVTENDYLFDETNGIYMLGPNAVEIAGSPGHYKNANYSASGKEAERPASFEVFDENGNQVFAQNIGIRIQGGYSRDKAQKSFAIFARSEYGPGVMDYAFFDNRPFEQYQAIQLRQGGQDQNIAKIKEATLLALVEGQGYNFIVQAVKPYVLYINGEYWGVYYMQEKRNEEFIAQHEGVVDADNMNIMKASTIVLQGSNTEYKELIKFVDSNDMSSKENFDYIAQYIDTDSFMDLMIHQIWIANSDYANLQYYQILPDGKWKQIYYDFCWTFQSGHETLKYRMDMRKAGSSLLNGLLEYKPWRDEFIERFAQVMRETYSTERVLTEIENQVDLIKDEMVAERAKFGGTVSNWETNVERMREFARVRNSQIVQQLKDTFPLSAEQTAMLEDAI